jgi:hypothetical protein
MYAPKLIRPRIADTLARVSPILRAASGCSAVATRLARLFQRALRFLRGQRLDARNLAAGYRRWQCWKPPASGGHSGSILPHNIK